MYKHCIVNGFAHALIEIRQDLIAERRRRGGMGASGSRRCLTTINRAARYP
jgi:predicted N-formylglutamate amidohydrolase